MSNNEELVIEVVNLNFSLGGSPILKNLNLKLHKGSRCLLVGNEKKRKSLLTFVVLSLISFLHSFLTLKAQMELGNQLY